MLLQRVMKAKDCKAEDAEGVVCWRQGGVVRGGGGADSTRVNCKSGAVWDVD
jgi:hypothetical protein